MKSAKFRTDRSLLCNSKNAVLASAITVWNASNYGASAIQLIAHGIRLYDAARDQNDCDKCHVCFMPFAALNSFIDALM